MSCEPDLQVSLLSRLVNSILIKRCSVDRYNVFALPIPCGAKLSKRNGVSTVSNKEYSNDR